MKGKIDSGKYTLKHLGKIERTKREIWISEGRSRGMQFSSYRKYKRAKRQFPSDLTCNTKLELYAEDTYVLFLQ